MQKKESIEIYKSQKSYTKSLHQGFHLRDLLKLDLQCTEKINITATIYCRYFLLT